ncbi:hypothetical protein AX17_003190 [Amanita inopinata Kibby_2008]|nr:hypothetical protein AX17_003190 [Amanita inopinata Kibby_2008]
MRYPISCLATAGLLLLALSKTALSCEGDCMTGITNAYVGNFSVPVHTVLSETANEIDSKLIQEHGYPLSNAPIDYLASVLIEWHKEAHGAMQTALFPEFFHGKCQQPVYAADGSIVDMVDPPGCPNPDCPVVCGTPGSMVHFFPKLRFIAFDATRRLLRNLSAPGSASYQQVEAAVLRDAVKISRRSLRFARAGLPLDKGGAKVVEELGLILGQIPSRLERICGGTGTGKTNGLRDCSWERPMKEYILSFP